MHLAMYKRSAVWILGNTYRWRLGQAEELPVVETAPPATGSSVFNRMRRPISGVCETSNVNSIVRPASSFLQNISESGYAP